MANFADSQHYAMSLVYNASSGFVPFLPSTNCYGAAGYLEALLPCGLAENLKCLRKRTTYIDGSNSEYTLIPILGMYQNDLVDWAPTWQTGSTIFITNNIPDNQYNIYEGSVHGNVFIDHNGRLGWSVMESYNQFVQRYFSNASVTMVNLSDNGISALEVLSMTRVWQEIPTSQLTDDYYERLATLFPDTIRYQLELERRRKWRKDKAKDPELAPLAANNAHFCQAVTSQQPFLRNAWSDVQDHWILPSWRVGTGFTITNASIDLQLSAYEPNSFAYNVTRQNTSDGINVDEHAMALGALNVVAQGGQSPGFCKIIDMATAKNQGDDIGSLIASFAEWMGGPTLGRFAGASYDLIKSIL